MIRGKSVFEEFVQHSCVTNDYRSMHSRAEEYSCTQRSLTTQHAKHEAGSLLVSGIIKLISIGLYHDHFPPGILPERY